MGWFSKPNSEKDNKKALSALQAGQFDEAVRLFEAAANAAAEEHNKETEVAALSNLGHLLKARGDLLGALVTTDRALAVLGQERNTETGTVFLTRGGTLDELGDSKAIEAWSDAAQAFSSVPLMHLVCLAHAEGARISAGSRIDPAAVSALISKLPSPEPGLVAGIIGAVGDSAGEAGIPLLAQVCLLMKRSPDAFNASTAPYISRSIRRVGPATQVAHGLCVLGLVCCGLHKGLPEYATMLGHVIDAFEQCARARGLDLDRYLDVVQSDSALFQTIEQDLRALVPDQAWIIAET